MMIPTKNKVEQLTTQLANARKTIRQLRARLASYESCLEFWYGPDFKRKIQENSGDNSNKK
jgi:hypothetical protein